MNQGYQLRPIQDRDHELLLKIYASTREDLAEVPWSESEKQLFLKMQFDAQHAAYTSNFPGAKLDIVMVGEVPVGRLYVHLRETEIRIIDIALLADQRGKGLGTKIMEDLLTKAQGLGQPVTIHVQSHNRARSLYQRLGFKKVGVTEFYDLMQWLPK